MPELNSVNSDQNDQGQNFSVLFQHNNIHVSVDSKKIIAILGSFFFLLIWTLDYQSNSYTLYGLADYVMNNFSICDILKFLCIFTDMFFIGITGHQASKYLKIGTCPASQETIGVYEKKFDFH